MTILGQHTISELRDLLAAKDVQVSDLQRGADSFGPTWTSQNTDTWNAWNADFQLMLARYREAHTKADLAITAAKIDPVSDNAIPAESFYQGVLSALRRTEGVISPGDYVDLLDRITKAGANVPSSPIPQPRKGADADLTLWQKLGRFDVIQTSKDHPVMTGALVLGVLGLVAFSSYNAGRR